MGAGGGGDKVKLEKLEKKLDETEKALVRAEADCKRLSEELKEAREGKVMAEAKLASANETKRLEIDLAVANAKMRCGGVMLQHFGGGVHSARTQSSVTDTPGSASAFTPAPLPAIANFFE